MKKTILAAAVAVATFSTSVSSHTNSIGYVGDGNGGLNFWYGNWHGTAFNEAEIKIEGTDANGTAFTWSDGNGGTQNYSIDAFNLLSQNSPAGLISGTNFFTSDGTQLVPYDPTGATNGGTTQESYVWQGINYTNLATGNYTFTYIPLGSAESSYPNQTPTMDWMPMDNVILSLSITLTQGDLNGDANNNGILDINEVAAGAASGPTLVSTSAPYIDTASYSVWTAWATNTALEIQTQSSTAYTASETNTIQTIDREVTTVVTTPQIRTRTYNIIETETYSDNSTQDNILSTGNVETATQDDVVTTLSDPGSWTGRIDQIATASDAINSILRVTDFDGVSLINSNNKYDNGMDGDTRGLSVGKINVRDNNIIVGGGFAKMDTSMNGNGDNVTGDTTVLSGVIGKRTERGDITARVTHGMTDYEMTRTIGDFANAGVTEGTDTSISLRFEGSEKAVGKAVVRPILGVTKGKRVTDAYTETGSVQSARTVAELSENYSYATVGASVDIGPVNLVALHNTDGVNDIRVGIERETEKGTWGIGATRTSSDLGETTSISLGLSIKF